MGKSQQKTKNGIIRVRCGKTSPQGGFLASNGRGNEHRVTSEVGGMSSGIISLMAEERNENFICS